MFPRLIDVKGLSNYRLALKYDDGTQGIADVSHLAHKGIFQQWDKEGVFNNVYIDKESNAVAWNEDLDLCPDSLYLKLVGLSFEDWKKKEHYATN
ncbi:DUF2442 domain-containing protein [Arcicella sp. LKC2W]|uniref:DUF2442 domain-containing protein n=1 Tax=Arcicella sp. LKC2W TaxID=2984198 RepID=UPI002B1F3E7C|nr:DUF2442 domain-containing protein [Arcicella sp. LKC2W]MEA5458151.1 DUF2442 domain-containing protein [Arcicella sp. LKC2W]